MATIDKWVPAGVEDVWAVIADARSYAFWVVGSHDVRSVEGDWPQPGATFHHTQGHGPLKLKDTSSVLECEPPHRLLLRVRLRPLGIGHVELRVQPDGEGTRITMEETLDEGPLGLVPQALLDPFLALRNADGLRRLAAMAWTRTQVASERAGTTPRSSASRTNARA